MNKDRLSKDGRRLSNIARNKAKRHHLTFVNKVFSMDKRDDKIMCGNNCGCLLTVGAHNSKSKTEIETDTPVMQRLLKRYMDLGFTEQYICGILCGFDDDKRQMKFFYSAEDYIKGYQDGWILQQRLIKKGGEP